MDDAVNILELPLFPLNTVLFPGQLLPLHIFEDRYRQMIRRCLAQDTSFGVVLIKQGHEAGEPAEPYSVGTLARIVESTHLPNGTLNIVAVGVARFRIRRLLDQHPYLLGEVETVPLEQTDDPKAAEGLADRVKMGVVEYIRLIADAAGLEIKVEQIPDTAEKVGYLAAITMQIDNKEKQELLGMRSVQGMLIRELELLSRENRLLRWMISTKDWPDRAQFGASGTLLPN